MPVDVLVIGGGIVGLASALKILEARPKTKVLLLEKEDAVARHQTGRNSGVLHSGIYYKPGSLKAENCVRGRRMLLDFCRKEEIPFETCGKLIVATAKRELGALDTLLERAGKNGLKRVRRLAAEEIAEHEPHARGLGALLVPETGIVDFSAVARRYAERFQERGGTLLLGEKAGRITVATDGVAVETPEATHEARLLVNCAGLHSDEVARAAGARVDWRIVPFRGEYWELSPERRHLVKNLIYPVPDPRFPFLGVHFTRRVDGRVEAGPNAVLALKREGYAKTDVDLLDALGTLTYPGFLRVAWMHWRMGLGELHRSFSKAAFAKALQTLVPEVRESDLSPGGSGVRAQACDAKGRLLDDFLIVEDRRAIHVGNVPSPAATASLAIGETIAGMALKRL